MQTPPRLSRGLAALLAASLLLGITFRNVWPEDMEWKADEQNMFEAAQRVGVSEPWPWTGMRSGVGLPNPGMSYWSFAILARVTRANDPLSLGRASMALNTVALLLLLLFSLRCPEPAERPAWLWATALAAVNPGAVQLQRKIWSCSILPIFCVATLYGWWNRRTRWGAFLWGAVGAGMAQIHMSGLFFVPAVAAWTAIFDRGSLERSPVRWRWWFAGSAATGWPLVPWAVLALRHVAAERPPVSWGEAFLPRFWAEWLLHLAGLQTAHSLGRRGFLEWIAEPRLGGTPTYLVGALVIVSSALVLAIVVGAGLALSRRRGEWRALATGASSTGLLQNATFLGFGVLLTASASRVQPHYLLVAYPLLYLWLARAALLLPRGRRLLVGLWAVQVLLSGAFLLQVHVHGGSPGGDYGVPFSRQPAWRNRGASDLTGPGRSEGGGDSVGVHQRAHLAAGPAERVGKSRVAAGPSGHGLEHRPALRLVAEEAVVQPAVGQVVGRVEQGDAGGEALAARVRGVVGPDLRAGQVEAEGLEAGHVGLDGAARDPAGADGRG
jgi:hypothetical protein